MLRKIGGGVAGAIAMIVVFMLAGGVATAMFHLQGLAMADSDHPHVGLAAGAIAVFALGELLAGLVGGYLAVLISRWPRAIWIVAVVGALDAFITSQLFANGMIVFVAWLVAGVAGVWLGGRLVKPAAAVAAG
ncbi:MAG: hypothetical protein JWP35_2802 [Caulobacter sp.]|nr:hypothetical protein [Caulobacter sp.]